MNTEPPVPSLVSRAREVWRELAGGPVAFPAVRGGLDAVVAPTSGLAPEGWVGIVELGGSAIATAPDEEQRQRVLHALSVLSGPSSSGFSLTDPDTARSALPVREVLGPATLGYTSADAFRPARAAVGIGELPARDLRLAALLERVGPDEAGESGLDEIDSPAFVLTDGSEVLAVAGYVHWPGATAHICLLTAPERRGQGLAQRVASAAVGHALARDMLPQWRARPPASRAVASALGFQELGTQLSLLLGPFDPPGPQPTVDLVG
ncbi:GNAT family N-acetyltransferase [Streptomyces profundus]|uniref:GNAT family N-acetyltransferase n=1 Tax=Streptomyces profundus TaxID=2867410 RepID=UPI001D15FF84|nr:GNAT family N-acetyltransferase [Streptomyces sp. MA3_2.13]UED85798.1 GNAT family N-acetyltransferase [Streptomyces sp. MA3_2.13]